jgi:uncharacterized protein (UPF0261 family)
MTQPLNILIVGSCVTKADEIQFIKTFIEAAGRTIAEICALGDENAAMTRVAGGAVNLTRQLYEAGKVQGMIAPGGTMGTDLALDVADCLPIGVPKFVVSTLSFSDLLPPDWIPVDLMMILWSGGLYGLSSICKASLSQAAGAVVGAARATQMPQVARPKIGITSLGKSRLKYRVVLKPTLEARGSELVVFHATGIGGRAFADLAGQYAFAVVLDLCLQEVSNDLKRSVVVSGKSRLEAAGLAGVPQIVAPGAADMVDFAAWAELSPHCADRPYHTHNRLIASVTTPLAERRHLARMIGLKLALAKAPMTRVLPLHGIEEWDRPGEALHDPAGLTALIEDLRGAVHAPARLIEVESHINDEGFSNSILAVLDDWAAQGIVPPGQPQLG